MYDIFPSSHCDRMDGLGLCTFSVQANLVFHLNTSFIILSGQKFVSEAQRPDLSTSGNLWKLKKKNGDLLSHIRLQLF